MILIIKIVVSAVALIFVLCGIRIVRPTHVGLIERFGKFKEVAESGFHYIIPIVDRMVYVNMTERMVDVPPQMVITSDKLNTEVDAVVYYKIREADKSVYNVNNHRRQLTSLARTTLRAVVGKMTLTQANENRDEINNKVEEVLEKETDSYGVHVLRVEIQKIEPPMDVQEAMNQVVKAEQGKIAANDIATALETKADGQKRALIKESEGVKQSKILQAEGEAGAIKLVNEAAAQYFKGNAVELKKLEVTAQALENNSKIIIPEGEKLVNVIGKLT